MAVADDGGDASECGQFIGCALRVAAGDDDLGVGIAAVRAAYKGARGAVCLCRHTACVDDHHVSLLGLLRGVAGGA